MSVSGRIFDIRRFSVHDGEGIRTTIFFKGCPLTCKWCQNPEGISLTPHLFYFESKCIRCGQCLTACPKGALSRKADGFIAVDRRRCALCFSCAESCPARALSPDSRELTARAAVEEALSDLPFFKHGGGVTLSGGEPFLQFPFALEILQRLKSQGINTAAETALHIPLDHLRAALPYLDTVFADCKLLDSAAHTAATGVSNEQILRNLDELLAESGVRLVVRTPLIPGYTATTENIARIAAYLAARKAEVAYELLNYNPLAKGKYALLEAPFCYETNPPLYTPEEMEGFRQTARKAGLSSVF